MIDLIDIFAIQRSFEAKSRHRHNPAKMTQFFDFDLTLVKTILSNERNESGELTVKGV